MYLFVLTRTSTPACNTCVIKQVAPTIQKWAAEYTDVLFLKVRLPLMTRDRLRSRVAAD
jgi:hypothetical protein